MMKMAMMLGRIQYSHSFKTIHITPLQTEPLTLCMNSHFLKHKMTEELSSVVQSKYKLGSKASDPDQREEGGRSHSER